MQPTVKDSAEFLPVWVDNEKRYLLNVTTIVDLIDKSKSTFKIYGDGQLGACQHAFLNDPTPEQSIFKVTGYLPRVFINETTKTLIECAQLTGVLIREYINP